MQKQQNFYRKTRFSIQQPSEEMERQNAVHSCSVLSRTEAWFCTNNTKDVYKDMLANPEVEVSVSSPEYAWIRLHGKAVFEDNKSVKEGCMNNPIVKGQYQTADNPIFEVFYLENPHGLIADFSGNPPYEF